MNKTEFFKQNGHRLVSVHEDDKETGNFMLFCPEESHIAQQYLDKGYSIASVFELQDEEDNVELDNDAGYSPFKIGYLILNN
jgi:hypothetical protein